MENTVALVTLYHPDSGAAENVRLIAEQVGLALLIDNTPGAGNGGLFSGIGNARYLANGRNLGLSAAFNRWLALPECRESDFLIFFDQDSRVVPNQVETLARDFKLLELAHKVGCLGPVFFEENAGRVCGTWEDSVAVGGNCFSVHSTITSSMMVRYATLEAAGFWNERVFLDYADLELGWRLETLGYENFVSAGVVMRHRMGRGSVRLFSPLSRRWLDVLLFEPARYYYQVRDGVKLARSAAVPEHGKALLRREALTRLAATLLRSGRRREALRFWLRGLADGLRGVDGALGDRG